MRVLLVSDNPRMTMQVGSAFLGLDDSEIFEVRTPERAVAILDDGEQFDIVIGDADTAPTGGFYLAREIKARGQMGRDMPPVILTIERIQDAYLAKWSQADAWVVKPIDPFNLSAVVAAVLQGEEPPALPGVGDDPTPSLLDIPGEDPGAIEGSQVGGASISSGAP